jgi:hypothetical protein
MRPAICPGDGRRPQPTLIFLRGRPRELARCLRAAVRVGGPLEIETKNESSVAKLSSFLFVPSLLNWFWPVCGRSLQ